MYHLNGVLHFWVFLLTRNSFPQRGNALRKRQKEEEDGRFSENSGAGVGGGDDKR